LSTRNTEYLLTFQHHWKKHKGTENRSVRNTLQRRHSLGKDRLAKKLSCTREIQNSVGLFCAEEKEKRGSVQEKVRGMERNKNRERR
jgi:hypothetical protein